MPTLEERSLVFRFPDIERNAQFTIDFMRTLRIPDSERTYSLPPGLGRFPLEHAEDHAENLPDATVARGGVVMPMWQSEAMWLSFDNEGPDWVSSSNEGSGLPVAVKIAAGKINAITGDPWRTELQSSPQDYVVSPEQPWLDGFAVGKGVIRQFVATPLGEGYSVEEQVTGEAEWAGIQISVTPLKAEVWGRIIDLRPAYEDRLNVHTDCLRHFSEPVSIMGLGAGGRMHQEIYDDPFDVDDWDQEATQRVFVSLLHAKDWKSVTGKDAPTHPLRASDYSNAGLPWFDYYAADTASVLRGSKVLAKVKSVAQAFKEKTGAELDGNEDVSVTPPVAVGPGAGGPRKIKSPQTW